MILVMGATGKIGSEVVRLLSEASIKTRVFVRDPKKAEAWPRVEIAQGNLDDSASIDLALRGVDTVFLLTNASLEHELAVIAAAKKAGVQKMVKVSSAGSDLDSPLRMGRNHAQAEEALKQSGMTWTILRPGMFMQNFLQFAPSIKAAGTFSASVRNGKASPIDARDIAEVAVRALTLPAHDGKTYVLTGKQAISYADAAAILSKASSRSVAYVDVPPEKTKQAMLDHGVPESLANDLMLLQAYVAKGTGYETEDFARVTGHNPRSFDDFARDYATAFE